jgi:hypothetical protein
MLVLFFGLILSLTAGLVYVVNEALLPRSPEGLAAAAENRCSASFAPESRPWRECLRREPKPPSQEALPFLLWGTGAALLGLSLTALSARGDRATMIPAAVLGIVIIAGTGYAIRTRDREEERLDRVRSTGVSETGEPTRPPDGR